MEIKRLTLSRFGCFTEKTFDLNDFSVIFGENRSGKTTLVYGIFFALFGAHLNRSLKVHDLCRKGEASATATILFKKGEEGFWLRRSTTGTPKLARYRDDDPALEPLPLDRAADLGSFISIDPEVASITSFFREGELIFFLQDIPNYNSTLLESLIKNEHVQIVRSRFRKCLSRAREARKLTQALIPLAGLDKSAMEKAQKRKEALESELISVEQDLSRLLGGASVAEAMQLRLIEERLKLLEVESEATRRSLSSIPRDDLSKEFLLLKEETEAGTDLPEKLQELERRLGGAEQKRRDIAQRLAGLEGLSGCTQCPSCGQDLSGERLLPVKEGLLSQAREADERVKAILEELKAVQAAFSRREKAVRRSSEIKGILSDAERLEGLLKRLDAERAGLKAEHDKIAKKLSEVPDLDGIEARRLELESRKRTILDELTGIKANLLKWADEEKRGLDAEKAQAVSARNATLCDVAYRAVDGAIQSLYSSVLEGVREALKTWMNEFDFLRDFEINITSGELMPLIKSKGYQYRLEQMSKSERIFLYLLLKLAIGDALGHLGVFVLDDPADGLDTKRKQILAELLKRVSGRRQIIVTTNDPEFASMCPGSALKL